MSDEGPGVVIPSDGPFLIVKLLACPFCGSPPVELMSLVRCAACGCQMFSRDAWNRRAIDPTGVERVRRLLDLNDRDAESAARAYLGMEEATSSPRPSNAEPAPGSPREPPAL